MARKKDVSQMTPEELEIRRKSHVRLFGLLVAFDVLLVIYLIYEIISVFAKR